MLRTKLAIFLSTFFFMLATFSCESEKTDESHVVNNRSCSIAIEGMMCEKGCKTTIQNKLREMEGVIHCDVDFELHQAYVSYDGNKINTKDIIKKINSIADGLYQGTLIEDKDIENAPVEIEHHDSNPIQSVSLYNLEIPDFYEFFHSIILL